MSANGGFHSRIFDDRGMLSMDFAAACMGIGKRGMCYEIIFRGKESKLSGLPLRVQSDVPH